MEYLNTVTKHKLITILETKAIKSKHRELILSLRTRYMYFEEKFSESGINFRKKSNPSLVSCIPERIRYNTDLLYPIRFSSVPDIVKQNGICITDMKRN